MTAAPQNAAFDGGSAGSTRNSTPEVRDCFILTGLTFLLPRGTFLGVWNLIAISNHRAAHSLAPAWIQAHGQAQMFGWIGTFIIGVGFYSLSKMGALKPFVISRGWQSWMDRWYRSTGWRVYTNGIGGSYFLCPVS